METVVIGSRSFVVENCFKCGVEFAVPRLLNETARRDKQSFWCPNGHGQVYTVSLRDVLQKTQQDRDEALAARDRAEASLRALQDRQRRGVCAFCKRSFGNVARHMAVKHPKKHA